ncbi:hypothetical protein [Rhodopirellula bahusiensis]|uniref:hypothetical protein n=1 Tax=Rhodopirellula bahusiensis TaxID=2014065 RepID=UPI00326735B5
MLTLIIAAVALVVFLTVLVFGAALLFGVPTIGVIVWLFVRGKSMVPRVVQKRMLKNLDTTMADEQINRLHKKAMEATGYDFNES